jgi:pimeloyl-ACP methyl ester carboxylesterase
MMPSRSATHAIRRAFVDTAAGQVHVRMSGSRDANAVPLLLLHQSPASSLTYAELLPLLADERWCIAPDTPGFGESYRPAAQPGIEDYARWIVAAADELGIARFDLFGLFTGAGTASEIAAAYPQRVRRLILAGPPLFTPERQAFFAANAWPMRPREDGSHLMAEWQRAMARPMPGVSFERRCDAYQEYYRGGANAIWGEAAIATYPLRDTLPRIVAPTLILEPEGIHADCAGAAALIPNARIEAIDHLGYAMLQAVPERVADCVRRFLT